MMIVSFILIAAAIYLLTGFVFAVLFVVKGVTKIDEGAVGSTWGFRVIIIPGVMIFWPLLWRKWMNAKQDDQIKSD